MISSLTSSVSNLASSLIDWETTTGGYPGEYDGDTAQAMAEDLQHVDAAYNAVSTPPQRVAPIDLSSFRSSTWLSDIDIECTTANFAHRWPAHKLVLAARSPVLAELFAKRSIPPASVNLDLVPELEALSDQQLVGLVEHGLLPFLYQGAVAWPVLDATDPPQPLSTPPSRDRSTVPTRVITSTALLSIAMAWEIDDLVDVCWSHKAQRLTVANVGTEFTVGVTKQCVELRLACHRFIAANFPAMVTKPNSFAGLPAEEMQRIISSDDLSVAEERTVFWGIVAWAEANGAPVTDFDLLVVDARLALMPFEQLQEVEACEWSSRSPKLQSMLHAAYRYRAAPPEKRAEIAEDLKGSGMSPKGTVHRDRSFSFV